MVVPVLVARGEDRLDETVFNAPPQDLDDVPAAVRGVGAPEPATA